jgi:hypothetical protein
MSTKKFSFLFRKDKEIEDEYNILYELCKSNNISLFDYRSEIPHDNNVICRYSCLPYYKELEDELYLIKNSQLINSHHQHLYIADMNYINDIVDFTPETWFLGDGNFRISDLPNDCYFILKGKTNSKKHNWNTHMFAKSKSDVPSVLSNIMNDSLIKNQGIAIRKYHELEKIEDGINGMPITNEWRFFCFYDKIVSHGFYWSILEEERVPKIDKEAFDLVNKTINIVKNNVNFYVIDVAKTIDGNWIVIEMNDGQMSGLSFNDPETLYKNIINLIKD